MHALDPNFALELSILMLEGSSYGIRPLIFILNGLYDESPHPMRNSYSETLWGKGLTLAWHSSIPAGFILFYNTIRPPPVAAIDFDSLRMCESWGSNKLSFLVSQGSFSWDELSLRLLPHSASTWILKPSWALMRARVGSKIRFDQPTPHLPAPQSIGSNFDSEFNPVPTYVCPHP